MGAVLSILACPTRVQQIFSFFCYFSGNQGYKFKIWLIHGQFRSIIWDFQSVVYYEPLKTALFLQYQNHYFQQTFAAESKTLLRPDELFGKWFYRKSKPSFQYSWVIITNILAQLSPKERNQMKFMTSCLIILLVSELIVLERYLRKLIFDVSSWRYILIHFWKTLSERFPLERLSSNDLSIRFVYDVFERQIIEICDIFH